MELTYMFVEIGLAVMLGVWVVLVLAMLAVLTIADVVLLTPWTLVRQHLVRPRGHRARRTNLD